MSFEVNLEVIKQRRNEKHLSLLDTAQSIGLKSADQYYRRESGQYNFTATELPALAKTLNLNMEDFFTPSVEKITN